MTVHPDGSRKGYPVQSLRFAGGFCGVLGVLGKRRNAGATGAPEG